MHEDYQTQKPSIQQSFHRVKLSSARDEIMRNYDGLKTWPGLRRKER